MAPTNCAGSDRSRQSDVAAVGVDVDERRRLADAAGRAQAELLDDAVVDAGRARRRETVARVSPVTLARSARDSGPSRCSVRSSRLRFARRASSGVAIQFVCLVDKQTPVNAHPSSCIRVPVRAALHGALGWRRRLASTDEPAAVVDLRCLHGDPRGRPRRWHGGGRPRRARRRGARRSATRSGSSSSSATACPAGFRARYFDLLQAFFALPEDVKAQIDKRPLAALPGLGARRRRADRQPHRLPRAARRLDREPAVPAPTPSRRTCASTAPTSGCPTTSCPASTAPSTSCSPASAPSPIELMEVLSVGLGLAPDHLRDVFGERPLSFAKLISYPPTPPGEAGVNAHHDAGFLTLLMQHGVGGLQVAEPRRRLDRRAAARRRLRRQPRRDAAAR